MLRRQPTAMVIGVACLEAACAAEGGVSLSGLLPAPGFSVASLPSTGPQAPFTGQVVGTPTEVYTRVARGALTCWFGAAGPLKKAYLYHADAAPPSRGGQSEIVIYVRDDTAEDPRSQRAFQVVISTVDARTRLDMANLKMPEPFGTRMHEDIARWAKGEEGCGEGPITAGWSAKGTPAAKSATKKAQRGADK